MLPLAACFPTMTRVCRCNVSETCRTLSWACLDNAMPPQTAKGKPAKRQNGKKAETFHIRPT